MRRVVKAITYTPKIQGVKDGTILTTIRYRQEGHEPYKRGDIITLHGWVGKPYRSPWSWRRVAELEAEEPYSLWVECDPEPTITRRIWWSRGDHFVPSLPREVVEQMAEQDGIEPVWPKSHIITLEDMMFANYLDRAIPHRPGLVRIPLSRFIWRTPFLEVVD